jgi:C1A family cysteine protease
MLLKALAAATTLTVTGADSVVEHAMNATVFAGNEAISDDIAAYDCWKEMYPEIRVESSDTRLQTFTANLRMVDAHNKRYESGDETYKMELNAFSHLTWKEFRSTYIGGYAPRKNAHPDIPKSIHYFNESVKTLPSSIDWTSKGAVTAVKNQGQCGSCW